MSDIDLGKVKNNVATMVQKGAPESDIDKYISSTGTTIDAVKGFKSSIRSNVSGSRAALDQGLSGATFGFSKDIDNVLGAAIASAYTGQPFHDVMEEAQGMTKQRMETENAQHPYISGGSQLGGALLTGGAGATTKVGSAMAKNIAQSGNLMKIAKGIGLGAASGGLSGAGSADPGHRLEGAEKGAKFGAATGGAGAATGQVLGKIIAPTFDKSVKLLRDAGVKLTPGQMSSHTVEAFKRMEGALGSVPLVGSNVRAAVRNSIESFNTAVLNKALKPIGEKMPSGIEAGRESIAKAEELIGKKYDALLPKLTFKGDQQFIDDLKVFNDTTVKKLPISQEKEFEKQINNTFENRIDHQTIEMDGKTFKKVESELSSKIRSYLKSSNPEQVELGKALNQFRGLLTESLERMNPKQAKELADINTSYAMFSRARDASINRGHTQGVFSPNDLSKAIKGASSKGAFARGDGLMQDLSDAANSVLPNTIPDSGTVERGLWATVLGGGGTLLNPKAALGAAAATVPYTKPGMAAVNKWANTTPTREAIRGAINTGTPLGSEVLGEFVGQK